MQTIITTIGTSLLMNQRWKRGQELPAAAATDAWLRSADLKQASAETHTWLKLGLLNEPERHRLVLVHTNTPDGRYCAERLKTWADGQRLACEIEEIAGLGTADQVRFHLGLAELAWKLARRIRGSDAVAIAATGGFKPETAIANLVGALLGAPVHYIYEGFEQLVTLAPLPVTFDLTGLRAGAGAALFREFGADEKVLLRRADIDSLLRQDPGLELYLETVEVDGVERVCLNAIGLIVRERLDAPAPEWPPASDLLPKQKIRVSEDGHHRPKGWDAVVDKLARNPCVTSIRYEAGRRGASSRVDPAAGSDTEIAVLIADGEAPPLGLRLSTTARNAAERNLLLRILKPTVRG